MSPKKTSSSDRNRGSTLLKGFSVLCNKMRGRKRSWISFLLLPVVFLLYLTFTINSGVKEPIMPKTRSLNQVTSSQPETAPDTNVAEELQKLISAKFGTHISQFSKVSNVSETAEEIHPSCSKERMLQTNVTYPKVTIIYSLYNVHSEIEALLYLHQNFQHLPKDITDDIIITADVSVSDGFRDAIEDAVDLCSVCRIFFLHGNVYEHRNFAATFAHNPYLVFADIRIVPRQDWLLPLLKCLRWKENLVVSPQLRLRYAEGSESNVGVSRNEILWDLGVVRGVVEEKELLKARNAGSHFVSQSVITKEVFAMKKQHFLDLRGFDIIPNITGGEHVSFSIKVLNCKGEIVTSLCSDVFLTVQNGIHHPVPSDAFSVQSDFYNPTFLASGNNVSIYYTVTSKVWMDAFSNKYLSCAVSRKLNISALEPRYRKEIRRGNRVVTSSPEDITRQLTLKVGHLGTRLKQLYGKWKCVTSNFKHITTMLQPKLLSPSKSATYYGYLRSRDGMFAFGMPGTAEIFSPRQTLPESGHSHQQRVSVKNENWSNFVLTRNASLWIGPFSFTNGAFIYEHVWCLTLTPTDELTLAKCVKGTLTQLFNYDKHMIKPAGVTSRCALAQRSGDVSMKITMGECSGQSVSIKEFKLDVEFVQDCIK